MTLRAEAIPFYPKNEQKIFKLRKDAPEFTPKFNKINYFHTIIDGKREGFSIGFSDDGIKVYEGEYRNDMRNGTCKWYYPTGNISMVAYYQNDKKTGLCISYYKNGNLKSVGNYVENVKKNVWFYWNEYGVLSLIDKIKN